MLKDLVLKNRSYRCFDESRKITYEELEDMIDHARFCASSVNRQPLVYYLASQKEQVDKIQPLTHWAKALDVVLPPLGHYPTAFIVVCQRLDLASNTERYLMDIGIVSQTILLRATELGLGGCMIANFNKEQLADILQLPKTIYPHLIIALGKVCDKVVLCEPSNTGSVAYYRDERGVHHVPKRSLEDLIINKTSL